MYSPVKVNNNQRIIKVKKTKIIYGKRTIKKPSN
jgi:hypothetical protein